MTTGQSEAPAMDGAAILAAARALAPGLAARSADIERARRLPPDVVAALRAAGMFRMAMPAARGGPQMSLPEQIEVLEVLAAADASVGWCVKIGADSGYFAGVMAPAVADELLPGLDLAIAGFAPPGPGRLDRVEGGYVLNGRFPFGSGSTHADLFFATGVVFEEDGRPAQGGQWGGVMPRIAFVKPAQVTIEDTWHSTGLSGTGSHHWVAKDVFVAERHTLDPFTQIRRRDIANYAHPLNFTATLAAIPLGIMARALDEALAFAQAKTVAFPPPARGMSTIPQVCGTIAQAHAAYRAARALVFESAQTFVAALAATGEAPQTVRATLGLSMIHATRTACDVVHTLFDLVGTAAIHKEAVMGRLLRDALTANQHVTVSQTMVETHGAALFGAPNPSPFF
ncbi:acyl-CoA dehydrogenase family protein [Sphingobium nicotianae]|uniref:Acyl-CoA dehydrogenase family protein n=1 Tax=Sphingobium nicotianae TaxID=2782607 RepID=A0A9X1IQK4_9SPHN|nr:acyl-CoA dehydrogenase family protein [Sphingobium nicotianae]MBT2186585.1 acyl-CoA dehydrogenase family protein [Sphingobium nicotianae]